MLFSYDTLNHSARGSVSERSTEEGVGGECGCGSSIAISTRPVKSSHQSLYLSSICSLWKFLSKIVNKRIHFISLV